MPIKLSLVCVIVLCVVGNLQDVRARYIESCTNTCYGLFYQCNQIVTNMREVFTCMENEAECKSKCTKDLVLEEKLILKPSKANKRFSMTLKLKWKHDRATKLR